ncbi:hypothetical protein HKI82_20380, partial [Vibrio plantisponsor]|nr:hypothetical protein [Vibrio plantisponsor]
MRKLAIKVVSLVLIYLLAACSGDNELMNIREQVSTVDIQIENEGQKPDVLYTTN